MRTRTKIAIARVASAALRLARRAAGRGPVSVVPRRGVRYCLDLREGIDLALWLGVFEPSTVRALRSLVRPGSVVLDIGANIGAHTLPLARFVGPAGRVIAFEPTGFAHGKLLRNLALNPALAARVVVERVMLTDGSPLAAALCSSWPLDGGEGLDQGSLGRPEATAGARALRLDDYLEAAGIERVDAVKLDVDGHELDVLAGAPRLLERSRPPIVLELAPYAGGPALPGLIGLLRAAGYRLERESSGAPLPLCASRIATLIPEGSGVNAVARFAGPS